VKQAEVVGRYGFLGVELDDGMAVIGQGNRTLSR
jgi:hypothetical protein